MEDHFHRSALAEAYELHIEALLAAARAREISWLAVSDFDLFIFGRLKKPDPHAFSSCGAYELAKDVGLVNVCGNGPCQTQSNHFIGPQHHGVWNVVTGELVNTRPVPKLFEFHGVPYTGHICLRALEVEPGPGGPDLKACGWLEV